MKIKDRILCFLLSEDYWKTIPTFAISQLFRTKVSSNPGNHLQWVKSASEARCFPSKGSLTSALSSPFTQLGANPVWNLKWPLLVTRYYQQRRLLRFRILTLSEDSHVLRFIIIISQYFLADYVQRIGRLSELHIPKW